MESPNIMEIRHKCLISLYLQGVAGLRLGLATELPFTNALP
ncbi:hypothetical protein L861_11680 [Litchfieldella anticariensis FP35 = DSM 16096]|uniref:Uncharacterized protein n=1 Tax=Litchfieldella anticariensis (strain DSM 16096 / CECT 5854 / CIP 108499 / LMG 22089 / FP35) TaxID=1121939 RepID=S2KGG8_LITA3|nr:hypothetical protein L861_11680 [Halomonas anticariensis FP35 = DSM 16096]